MKVLHLSSFDLDGGAAKAAYRLHCELLRAGVDSHILCQVKSSKSTTVIGASSGLQKFIGRIRPHLDALPLGLLGYQFGSFSSNILRSKIRKIVLSLKPDVINLHWINAGFFCLTELQDIGIPVVWTMHDMWAITGGCHYDMGCGGYLRDCTLCPMQSRLKFINCASLLKSNKIKFIRQNNVKLVSPSEWLANVCRSSMSDKADVTVIANGVDLSLFKAHDKQVMRSLWRLPLDRYIILFGAVNSRADVRKGFSYLSEALSILGGKIDPASVMLCIYGGAGSGWSRLGDFDVFDVGHISDETSLISLYSAIDLFVAPSIQDNLPNTVVEAAACSVPSVAFDIGGMPDIIEDGVSGYLAESVSAVHLADTIFESISDKKFRLSAGREARLRAERRFDVQSMAASYMKIYNNLLS